MSHLAQPAGQPPADPAPRAAVAALATSKVREIANAGFGREDLLKFWFGESETPTPDYIRRAAIASIEAGETFYAHNNGRADLRTQLSSYLQSLHGGAWDERRVSVTSSGISALAVAMQALLDPGSRVVVVTPVWPNVTQIPRVLGADVVRVPLEVRNGKWSLDLDRLLALVTPDTRLLVINSPGNPTGWTLAPDQRQPILDHCRRLGVWLLTDDVYERLVFDPDLNSAPSFLPLITPPDRVISANSFSKAWLMTGWRLGWLAAPPSLEEHLGKLIEFNTSCAPGFVQAAGLMALREGEPHVAALRAELAGNAQRLARGLQLLPGVETAEPTAGMYVFFRPSGRDDSVRLARRLMAEAGLGLAPGSAFGPEGEGWLRWCVAAREDRLADGLERFARWHALHSGRADPA